MTTTVVNLHHKPRKPYVFIGRGGPFGNPYVIGYNQTRATAIKLYASYAAARVQNDPMFRFAVSLLKGKVLACYCAPLPCHGDILARMADGEETTVWPG